MGQDRGDEVLTLVHSLLKLLSILSLSASFRSATSSPADADDGANSEKQDEGPGGRCRNDDVEKLFVFFPGICKARIPTVPRPQNLIM